MWVFTQHGFYSVVAAKPSKDRSGKLKKMGVTSDDTHVLVRARVKEDLEDLKTNYMPDLEIFTETGADYSHRCYMTRQEWKGILAVTVDELDYDSHFKEASRDGSKGAPGRYSAYMGVWSELARLQDTKPYSGSYSGSTWTSSTPQHPSWDDDGQPLGHEQEKWANGYRWDAVAKCYVKSTLGRAKAGKVSQSATPAAHVLSAASGIGKTTIDQCKALLLSKSTEDFTTKEVEDLDEEAFELYKRADDLPPSQQPVSRQWADDAIATLNEEWLEALEDLSSNGYDVESMSLEEVLATLPDVSNNLASEVDDLLERYSVVPHVGASTGWDVWDAEINDTVGSFFARLDAEAWAADLNAKDNPTLHRTTPATPAMRIYDPLEKKMVDITDENRERLLPLPPGAKSSTAPKKATTPPKGLKVEQDGKTTQVIPEPAPTK